MQFRPCTTLIGALALSVAAGCGGSEDETPEDTAIQIAEARALPSGASATVEGVVTVAPGTFRSATEEQGLAIQDSTAGIYVSMTEGVTAALGARVRATGTLAQTAEQTVLVAERSAVVVEPGQQDISPEVVKTGEVGEPVEGLLIRVAGQVTGAVTDDTPYGFKVFVDDGSGEVQVFVHIVEDSPVIDTASLEAGQTIEVTGLAAQYEATYEVCPRRAEDLVIE
ncbi:DNA-binding protein [Sorangium sp. So ce1099]|uniref:DNA-binding protein n=1 Tax=Sorangium sp. So ce1099 TaxID=3133331 RepID=UPI003F634A13